MSAQLVNASIFEAHEEANCETKSEMIVSPSSTSCQMAFEALKKLNVGTNKFDSFSFSLCDVMRCVNIEPLNFLL